MPTITVKNQDELTRVLANATSDIAVEMGPDAHGMVQDYDILAPTNAILKVAKGAKLTAHVPDLTVDVNGGVFDGNNKPHHVFINSGSATAGRGSKVTALGGTFRERGGATDAKTSAHIDNDAQAHISSGVVNVHNKARVTADGNAEVYAFDDAKVDAFGRAKVRADDNVVLRAHDHSEGHLHGKAQGYGSGPVVMTMVSPASKAQVGSSARLRVGEGVSHEQFSNSADVEPEFISATEARLPDTLNTIRGRGKNAYHRNAPAAPIMDEEVAKFLEGREPGDPLNIEVMKAFEEGYRSQADAAAAMVMAVDDADKGTSPPSSTDADADSRLKTFKVTTPEGVREWRAEDEDHAREQHADAFPGETVIAVSTRDDASHSAPSEKYLVYTDEGGEQHYQPVSDIPDSGTLIDPVTGDDMDVVGWADSHEGDVRTDPMDIIYEDSSGNQHAQPWGDVVQSGGLIDDEGEDMRVVGGTGTPSVVDNDDDEESCCAGCDCGNACAQGCPVGPVCSEYTDKPSLDAHIAVSPCGKCHHPVEDCMCFSGPSFPLTEKVAVIPSYRDDVAVEDETLVKVGHKNDAPHTVQSFDWQRGRWGRSMIVAGGPGKTLLTELERAEPSLRKVPANVAAAYGHATGKCLMCSKPLSDAASLSRGYGRSCASKLG